MATRVFVVLMITLVSGCAAPSATMNPGAAQGWGTDAPLVVYRCGSGATLKARYEKPSKGLVEYRGKTYVMRLAISADGARYAGGGLEWWTKGAGAGSGGTVFHHADDGTTGRILDRCRQISGARHRSELYPLKNQRHYRSSRLVRVTSTTPRYIPRISVRAGDPGSGPLADRVRRIMSEGGKDRVTVAVGNTAADVVTAEPPCMDAFSNARLVHRASPDALAYRCKNLLDSSFHAGTDLVTRL